MNDNDRVVHVVNAECTHRTSMDDNDKEYIFRWGLPLKELYNVALKFYKEKGSSVIQFSYDETLRLIAYIRQVNYGKYDENVLPPLGVLDVIGRDRRLAWQALGDMSQRDAMAGFIGLIDKRCLHFNSFVQAQKTYSDEQRKRINEEKVNDDTNTYQFEENNEQRDEEELRKTDDKNRERIQDALNAQTYRQFKSYAEQQFPHNPEQQTLLIRQLQDQHYHQYVLQLHQQHELQMQQHQPAQQSPSPHSKSQHQSENSVSENANDNEEVILECDVADTILDPHSVSRIINDEESDTDDTECDASLIHPPSMWTRKNVEEFKNEIQKEGAETIVKVGHGETVTVRVPTNDDGSCLFWEFATDNYDIGFGVYFEWEKPVTKEVSVHISETEDEDSDDLIDDDPMDCNESDIEKVRLPTKETNSLVHKPPVSVIVPIYRRDCHEEVYVGSHLYPGEGVYLLKFDNSYSLWRSKTLYYRIYYKR